MSVPLVEAKGVSLGYGHIPIVQDLTLRVCAGEIVCLLGANGAGKSTTLLGLAGVLRPIRGEILCLGRSDTAPLHVRARRGLAFVPEQRSVFFGQTVHENLKLGPGSVDKALEYAPELRSRMRQRAGLLSGGEQQILTLARALAGAPSLLLADELTLGLAPRANQRLLGAVRSAADAGLGVLLVEQHLQTALSISDRGYVIKRGRVVMEGRASDLLARSDEVRANYLTSSDS